MEFVEFSGCRTVGSAQVIDMIAMVIDRHTIARTCYGYRSAVFVGGKEHSHVCDCHNSGALP